MITDVMIDIETVGKSPGCPVIQIAAVPFNINTGIISANTYCKALNLNFQTTKLGLLLDKSTYAWWMKENPLLFKTLMYSTNHPIQVATEFQNWFTLLPNHNNLRVWGNSNRFDLGIIEGFYQHCIDPTKVKRFNPFWNTWLERDVRTIAELAPAIKANMKFVGTKHNAIDDCKHQIKYVKATLDHYKIKL